MEALKPKKQTFRIFDNVTSHSNYVTYLLECVMNKIQHVGKSETLFNIRLNIHWKDIKKQMPWKHKHFNKK